MAAASIALPANGTAAAAHPSLWHRPWLRIMIAVDLLLLAIACIGRMSVDQMGFRLSSIFQAVNLGAENNLAAWWSGALLLLAAFGFAVSAQHRLHSMRAPWLLLAALWTLLSLDEVGSLHERLTGFAGGPRLVALCIVGLLIVVAGAYAGLRLLLHPQGRRTALYLLAAALLYSSVVLQEYIQHHVDWPAWSLGLRVLVEEGTELLGTYMVFRALIAAWQGRDFAVHLSPALLVPLALGLLFHAALTLGWAATLTDLRGRGDPAAFYPMALFLGLAFWIAYDRRHAGPMAGLVAPLLLVALSSMMLVSYGRIWPLGHLMPGDGVRLALLWSTLWPLARLAGLRPRLPMMAALLPLPLSATLIGMPGGMGLVLGLSAFAYALIFLTARRAPYPG